VAVLAASVALGWITADSMSGRGAADAAVRADPAEPTYEDGLITAAGGAARADVLQRIEGRFPVPVIVAHAAMQGPACAGEVVRALAALDADPRVDVILLARGGGSLQDLLPFSDESVVRAIRGCATPVVAGIGHEPDITLACLAADARGATPTAAADLVVPDRAALAEDVGALGRRLAGGLGRVLARGRRDLDLLGARPGLLRPHEAVVRRPRERVHALGARLHRAVVDLPTASTRDLAMLRARHGRAGRAAATAAGARLAVLGARRVAGDPTAPLGHGFALVRDASGQAITSAVAAGRARDVVLEFADGTVPATVREGGGT
jgi:exodeoxyribonuclease VII large subunit